MIPRLVASQEDLTHMSEAELRECWRWHFAGQIALGLSHTMDYAYDAIADWSVKQADALITELEEEK
jgi:hypothetical protein